MNHGNDNSLATGPGPSRRAVLSGGAAVLVAIANATYDGQVSYDGSYFLVVPAGASGIGFLGDAGKFVSLGSQRISSLSDNGTLKATVEFAAGDGPVTLHGYSQKAVTATATGGSITSNAYSTATQRFSLVVAPGSAGTASVTINA